MNHYRQRAARIFEDVERFAVEIMKATCMVACGALCLLAAACGAGTIESPQTPGQAGQTAAALTRPASSGRPDCTLAAEQAAPSAGTRWIGYINGEPATVSFRLDGPWDFSDGPTERTMTREVLSASEVNEHSKFPGADSVLRVTSSLFEAGAAQYEFFKSDARDSRQFGVSFSWISQPTIYDPPFRDRVYPLAVGDSWRDTYRLRNAEGASLYNVHVEVLACGTAVVPAGRFEKTVLIRQTLRGIAEQGRPHSLFMYQWLAPNVGYVAWITSVADEQRRVFDRAANFYRLKQWRPGTP